MTDQQILHELREIRGLLECIVVRLVREPHAIDNLSKALQDRIDAVHREGS